MRKTSIGTVIHRQPCTNAEVQTFLRECVQRPNECPVGDGATEPKIATPQNEKWFESGFEQRQEIVREQPLQNLLAVRVKAATADV